MKQILTLILVSSLAAGCSAISPKAATPLPTEELNSVGQHSSKRGSYQVAFKNAEKFCHRWRAAPSIIRKQVTYQGQLEEDTQTAINIAFDVARAAGNFIPGFGSRDAYETTLIYKCY
jgi:hypothetical protein